VDVGFPSTTLSLSRRSLPLSPQRFFLLHTRFFSPFLGVLGFSFEFVMFFSLCWIFPFLPHPFKQPFSISPQPHAGLFGLPQLLLSNRRIFSSLLTESLPSSTIITVSLCTVPWCGPTASLPKLFPSESGNFSSRSVDVDSFSLFDDSVHLPFPPGAFSENNPFPPPPFSLLS